MKGKDELRATLVLLVLVPVLPIVGSLGCHLALSSRNGYLDATQRAEAVSLSRELQHIAAQVRQGLRDYAAPEQAADAQEVISAIVEKRTSFFVGIEHWRNQA